MQGNKKGINTWYPPQADALTRAPPFWTPGGAHEEPARGPVRLRPQRGPFADNPAELQEFIEAVLAELAPVTAQERAEALNIVGLYVRRSRLVELEAMALAHATRTRMLAPAEPGGPPRVAEED